MVSEEMKVIRSDHIDYSLADEIMAESGGEHLYACSSCGTCAATCLIRRFNPAFNPRALILKATLGLRDEVLSGAEIWECSACDQCYPRCPHGIHISDVMKAIRIVAIRHGYERPTVTATVRVQTCVACGRCVKACPYEAIALQEVKLGRTTKQAAQVDRILCAGCGICNAVCPSSSIGVEDHSDKRLHESLLASASALAELSKGGLQGKLLAIVCNWCLHSTLDAAAAANPPDGVDVLRVPCTGRVSTLAIMTALRLGIDGVLVVGCKDKECHYLKGNNLGSSRVGLANEFLGMLGVPKQRLKFVQVGMLDRGRFPRLLKEALAQVRELESISVSG